MKRAKLISDPRRLIGSAVYAYTFAAAFSFGHQMERLEHLVFTFFTFSRILLLGALLTVTIYLILGKLHEPHPALRGFLFAPLPKEGYPKAALKKVFWRQYLGLILCQMPVFLGVFPGFFAYDANDEWMQVATRTFSTHHPLFHVLSLGGTVQAVHKLTGSYNAGIAVFIAAQAIVICAAFATVLTFLYQKGVSRKIRVAAFLFLGCFPPIVMYTLCSSKDAIFSAALLLFTFLLAMFAKEGEAFVKNKGASFILLLSATLMLLYRKNAIYAYLVFLLFAIPCCLRSKVKVLMKRGMVLLLLPVLLATGINEGLRVATNAHDGAHQEILTVPIQQLARVHYFHAGELSEEDLAVLYRYLPENYLRSYRPRLSDPVKVGFDNGAYEADKASFWQLWWKTLKRNPAAYINAWWMTSYGYWYPLAVINVYQGNSVFTFTYDESSSFAYETEPPGERHSLIPVIDEFYKTLSIRKAQQEIPGLSLLFSPAFYFWLHAFVALYLLTSADPTQRRRTFYYLPMFLYWLTLLLGPTYLVRYVVILMESVVLIPVFIRRTDEVV